jgi:hypothetical protein
MEMLKGDNLGNVGRLSSTEGTEDSVRLSGGISDSTLEKPSGTQSFERELEQAAKKYNDTKPEALGNVLDEAADETDYLKILNDEASLQAALIAALHFNFEYTQNFIEPENEDVKGNLQLLQNIKNLQESAEPSDPLEPIINLDKEKLKMSIEFPALQDLKSVTVQYDPASRSIAAEMLTSQDAARVLQAQVSQLERNLAKHNIKLQSLKISQTPGNSARQNNQEKKDNKKRSKFYKEEI